MGCHTLNFNQYIMMINDSSCEYLIQCFSYEDGFTAFILEKDSLTRYSTFEFSNFSCDKNVRSLRSLVSMLDKYFSQSLVSINDDQYPRSRDQTKHVPILFSVFLEFIQHGLRANTEEIPQEGDSWGPRG